MGAKSCTRVEENSSATFNVLILVCYTHNVFHEFWDGIKCFLSLFFFFFFTFHPPFPLIFPSPPKKPQNKCPNTQLQNSPESVSVQCGFFHVLSPHLFYKEGAGGGGGNKKCQVVDNFFRIKFLFFSQSYSLVLHRTYRNKQFPQDTFDLTQN